jgi:hypothetical protein
MINSRKLSVRTAWNYFFLLPFMVLAACLLNSPVVKSQNRAKEKSAAKRDNKNHDIKMEGSWFATIEDDNINMQFKSNDDNLSKIKPFKLSEFKDLATEKQGTFTLTREAGTMELIGKFEGAQGMGHYKFLPNKTYSDELHKEEIEVTEDSDLIMFFLVNVKTSYVQMLKQNGYTTLDKDKLIPLAALNVDEAYIKSIKAAGFTHISLDTLIPLKALNVDKAYIEEIRKAGYSNISADEIITLKAQGIDGKYTDDFRGTMKNEDKETPKYKRKRTKQ